MKTIKENKMDKISSRKKDMVLEIAKIAAENLKNELESIGLSGIEIAGSIRREKEIVGDIDLMAMGDIEKIQDMKNIEMVKGGSKSVTFMYNGHQVNLYKYESNYKGSMLMFLTGPGGYNIGMRCHCKKRGYKLSQYGLKNLKTGENFSETEMDIYNELGKHWKEPKVRGLKK
jgi:DNA polymerase (family X)